MSLGVNLENSTFYGGFKIMTFSEFFEILEVKRVTLREQIL